MGSAKQRTANEPPATTDDIVAAIQALTPGELVRIRKFAYRRYWTLGRRGAGLSPEDLIQDAMMAILDGRRKWRKSRVDFLMLLIGVIKSLTSHIVDGKPRDAFDDVVDYQAPEEDTDALDRMPSPAVLSPEEQLEAEQLEQEATALVRKILDHFKDDDHALIIYQGLCESMKPAEIRECGLSEKEYDAAQKRLKRGVRKLAEGSHL